MKCEICNKICFMGWKTEKQKQNFLMLHTNYSKEAKTEIRI